jgi:GTPase KRas protein
MGRSGVGKTAITLRYTRDRFVQEYDPTIEDLHLKYTAVGGTAVSLEILDTAGQEAYSALRRSWMQHGAGFLFVFSVVDRQTFDELRAFYDELMDLYNNDPPPSVLVANKADLDSDEWAVTEDEVRRLKVNWRNCTEVVFVSAKSNRNVEKAFDALCLSVQERVAKRRKAVRDRDAAASIHENPATAEVTTCRRCRFARCVDVCVVN